MANCNSNSNQKRSSSQLAFSLASNRDIMKSSSSNRNGNRNHNRNRNCNHRVYIPDDMILDILLRLPVKSLIRFKSVCKSWFSLVSNPHFAESHFNQALTPPSHRLLYIIPPLISSAFKSHYSIDVDASLHHHHVMPLPNTIINNCDDPSKVRFQGSCRGFVLLDNYPSRNLFLWNPSTGAHKTLPYPPILVSDAGVWHRSSLGYDVAADDYLVLMICFTFGTSPVTFCAEIFSVRTSSWEQILFRYEPYVGPTDLLVSGLFLNGAIHWRLTRRAILCFDLRLKKFSEMGVPNAFCHSLWETHLIALGGCLAMCNRKEVWVMKEYKVHSSWTKFGDLHNNKVSVVHINRAGEVIGLRDRSSERGITVVKLNDKGEEVESREFSDLSFEVREAFYMESLLSLSEK